MNALGEKIEEPAEETVLPPLHEDLSYISSDYYGRCSIVGNYICCSSYGYKGNVLAFFDTEENKLSGTVEFPEKYSINGYLSENGALLRVILCEQTKDGGIINTTAVIYEDFSYEIIGEPVLADYGFSACGHNIAHSGLDIVDTDTGETIVSGYIEEGDQWGFTMESCNFILEIDESRFLYWTLGYERMCGFGIYDFETGAAVHIDGSEDFEPLGYRNGKIYAVKRPWDGFGTELYVFDSDTYESEFFMTFPFDIEPYEYGEYVISEDGKYMAIVKPISFKDIGQWYSAEICTVDIETGEVIGSYDIPDEYRMCQAVGFIGDRLIIQSDGEDKGFIILKL